MDELEWRFSNWDNDHIFVHTLPSDIAQKCRRLTSELGIDFGAIDMALTNEDSYTFFEINPNGEWLWIQQQLGFPIAESISEWLTT